MRRSSLVSLFLVFLLALAGCSLNAPEELDRLMKEDAGFKRMIGLRNESYSQIHLIKQDLLSKKRSLDAQTDKLRREYDGYARAQNEKMEKYRMAIEANRSILKHEWETLTAQLAAKLTELKGYQRTLADVRRVLRESKGIEISSQERQKWEERVLLLSEKIRPLGEEIEELKLQIRLKKRKASFLR
ncbi:MAG: hypothetical protein HY593_01540 [Candidatus Omnitrophica bacterium]|nr:hypothetical protein [Candidatus Omnitrophota bacterium]